jgi:hypothetical protein
VTERRRRRRSRDVALVAVPLLAASFTACGGDDTAYCVDKNDRIVENRLCDDERFGIGESAYFWYYGGHVASGGFVRGAHLTGGDRISTANITENVRRGGFGVTSRSASSGVGRATGTSGSGGNRYFPHSVGG